VCVCVKPTRIKVRYFKATSINAVNNVGIIDRNRFKVKMWACENFREIVFGIEIFVVPVSYQDIRLMVSIVMKGKKISINGKQIRKFEHYHPFLFKRREKRKT
jgi:hypothetical protein